MNPDVTHVHERGTWQLCHVRRLAFPLNISFYLMQHTPLWRSKFWILRIKKKRTKVGTLRISHTSSKLHLDIPSGSFSKTDLRKIGAITDKVWHDDWVEHTSVAQVEVSGGLLLFVSVSCYAFIIKFVHDLVITILVFSPIQQARYIRVSISEFQKTCLCKFSTCLRSLDVSCTNLWRCKLKSPQNGDLKKSVIHLSRNIIHMTYTTFIFLKAFWIRTKTVNVRGKSSINMNEPKGFT